ncbi:MAG: hypothetical protein P8181_12745 [bacterium]
MNRLLIVLFCTVILAPVAKAGKSSDQKIINAFLKSPETIDALAEAKVEGYEIGEVRLIPYRYLCGVAGCNSSVLVVQALDYKRTNPHSTSLMSLVRLDPKGNVTSVKRVVLVNFDELDEHE